MYIIEKIKMIIRCWRYRFKSEVASIKYVRNLPKKDSIVLDIGANKGIYSIYMSRAIGEAAPVIAISALVYLTFIPSHPMDRFTVLPIQIYNWVSRPQDEFRGLAAAGIIVMLVLLLSMNAIAVFLRNKYQKRSEE